MATHKSYAFHKGEDWTITVSVRDAGGSAFTVSAARFELLTRALAPVVSYASTPQVSRSGSSVAIRVAPADQTAIAPGYYVWRVWAADSAGISSYQVEGEFLVKG